jgi:hypothetical protein
MNLPKQFSNGRIDIEGPSPSAQFALFDKMPISSQCTSFTDAMTGNWIDTPMSLAFFSDKNMQIIQNGIRAGVYNESGGKYDIGPQDCDSLKMIMRAIYLESAMNQPTNITEQIASLNGLVCNWCTPRLISEARAYINYKRDVSNMYTLIPPPTLSTMKGKTLELKPWF